MAENLWTTRSVSIIGFSQSILNAQTPKFEATLDQQVKNQMTYFVVDYERSVLRRPNFTDW
jgi:serine/threonine-protein kinase RIO1